jgi:hypothetical protein
MSSMDLLTASFQASAAVRPSALEARAATLIAITFHQQGAFACHRARRLVMNENTYEGVQTAKPCERSSMQIIEVYHRATECDKLSKKKGHKLKRSVDK